MTEPTLDPYQKDAVSHLLGGTRRATWDEPGVGKTAPSIMAAATQRGPRLVICPAFLVHQWGQRIQRWRPEATVLTMIGPPKVKEQALKSCLSNQSAWLVTSYHMLAIADRDSSRYTDLMSVDWGVTIYDEAHTLRNRKAKWTIAAWKLKSRNTYLLSGTPEVRDAGNWYPLLRLLDALPHKSYWKFVNEWCRVSRGNYSYEIGALLDPGHFHRAFGRLWIRRTLEELGLQQQPTQRMVPIQATKATARRHAHSKRAWRHPTDDTPITEAGSLVHALRLLTASDPRKMETVKQIHRHVPTSERVVIFCWYRHTRDTLGLLFKSPYVVRAENPESQRRKTIDAWACDKPGYPLVATIPSIGEGIDLTASSTAIVFEESYLETQNEQAIARLVRRGQENHVTIWRMYLENTIDHSVRKAAAARKAMTLRDLLEV